MKKTVTLYLSKRRDTYNGTTWNVYNREKPVILTTTVTDAAGKVIRKSSATEQPEVLTRLCNRVTDQLPGLSTKGMTALEITYEVASPVAKKSSKRS
jgi:hypothetical protein